jgi:hypothetical protein
MVETQSRNTMSRPVDCFLQSLVEIVNDESANIGFRHISSETASTIEETFKRLGDVYDPIQKESQGSAAIPKPYLIHLKDAQIYQSGASHPPSEKRVLWRGRLEAVDGFSLGKLSLR